MNQLYRIIEQTKCETGNYSSAIALENNNLFGIRLSVLRDKYHIGSNRGHAVYNNIGNSVSDYLDLLDYNSIKKRYYSRAEWAALMKNIGYYKTSYEQYLKCMA